MPEAAKFIGIDLILYDRDKYIEIKTKFHREFNFGDFKVETFRNLNVLY